MLKISIEQIVSLLDAHDGNRSQVYNLIKDRLQDYDEREIAFADEFLFFEKEYLTILKHIKQNNIPVKKIIDIGCQLGFQSELFDAVEYVGIDSQKYRFFNQGKQGVSYLVGVFPYIDINLHDAVVVSCMSLGYFNDMVCEDEEQALKIIADKLSECTHLILQLPLELADMLKDRFKQCELLLNRVVLNRDYPMYYFSQTEEWQYTKVS